MNLKESGEMYLETILILQRRNNVVRSIDIAEEMGFSKPSVSRAVGNLKEDKYILVDKDGYIALTEKGYEVAEKIYERHNIISSLLMNLGISKETALKDACKIEHDISDESFEAIKKHLAEKD